LYYYSILEFFHAIAIIPMQVLLLCSIYAHFKIELELKEGQTSLPLASISPCSSSSLLSPMVRMSLSSCWSLFDSLLWVESVDSAYISCCHV